MLAKRIGVIMYQTSKSKGQELVAQRMVREFIRLGHKAYLITSIYHDGEVMVSSENLRKIGGYMNVEDKELGIPIIRVDSFIARWPPRRIAFRDFISILERIVEKFELDVLITHSTLWNGPEEVAKFIEWRRYMKNVGGYQDPLVFCHMSHFQEPSARRYSLTERSFRIAWNRLTLPQIFSTANLVLVVTPFEKETKVKMGADAEKCFLFPGGVDDESFHRYANVDVGDFVKRLKINEDTMVVSYLGSLEERKNPMGVLRVAEGLRDMKNIRFVMAGRGDSSYAKRVVETAKGMPNVTYLGEVSEEEKVQLIKVSHVNILLSRSEALGLTQLEFMYLGVPVVTSAVGGQKWLIRNEVDGIHVKGPDDVEGSISAVKRLFEDHAFWNELSANARERAKGFTISKLTAELDEAIEKELVEERGLAKVPSEVRVTLAEPENVLRSWSSGSWGITATERRLFVKKGFVSRKVIEIPYRNISSIEHLRRYSWKTLVAGFIISLLLLMERVLRPTFPPDFKASLDELLHSVFPSFLFESPFVIGFFFLLPVLPLLIGLVVFVLEARVGFVLRGPGIDSLYLPGSFREAIAFVRSVQDGRLSRLKEKERP